MSTDNYNSMKLKFSTSSLFLGFSINRKFSRSLLCPGYSMNRKISRLGFFQRRLIFHIFGTICYIQLNMFVIYKLSFILLNNHIKTIDFSGG